ncbi:hypothetical protein [Aggregatibacter kilianii]|jgi:hypothetical protein|uniref:hypothetical protein n=1 Tax=Aggregatibacter kilianii TaxID=2025884 RepID=UPI0013A631BC|nr:hypothetical protein [Aggregatibacter kilianii]
MAQASTLVPKQNLQHKRGRLRYQQYQPKVRLQNPKDFERWFTNGLKGEQSNKFDCE